MRASRADEVLRIRPLRAEDQRRLWHWLHVSLWDPPPAPMRPKQILDAPHVRVYAQDWGRRSGDVGVTGEIDQAAFPIGACWMRLITGGAGLAYIDDETPQLGIAIEPSYQRMGHGRRLMIGALSAARAHGYRQVALTVHPQNPAVRMYEECGFERRGLRNGYHLMATTLVHRPYAFSGYSPRWPAAFAEEAARLRVLLGAEVVDIHHIGSTSVPGIAAKPVIDMLPLVRSLGALDRRTGMLQRAGYRAWGEYGLAGRRYFTRDREAVRTHNLHFYQAGDPDVERHLAFCAYLREHPSMRDAYAALKRHIHAMHPDDVAAYASAKTQWIRGVEPVAVEWYRRRRRVSA